MAKWDYLLEAGDKRLRGLERAYISSGDPESAQAYINEARRKREIVSSTYFDALWTTGEGPDPTVIVQVVSIVSDVFSWLILDHSDKKSISTENATIEVWELANPGTEDGYNSFNARTNLATSNIPQRFDREHMRWTVKWLKGIEKNLRKLKLHPRTTKKFKDVIILLNTLAGDE